MLPRRCRREGKKKGRGKKEKKNILSNIKRHDARNGKEKGGEKEGYFIENRIAGIVDDRESAVVCGGRKKKEGPLP